MKSIAIDLSKVTNEKLHLSKRLMIQQRVAQLKTNQKQSFTKKPIKSLTKKNLELLTVKESF